MQYAKYDNRLVVVIEEGAYTSVIRYNELGMQITEYVENSDLEFLETEDEE